MKRERQIEAMTALDPALSSVVGEDLFHCREAGGLAGELFLEFGQFFVAPIKDDNGQVVNYVGVQCEVNTMPIHEIKERVKKLPIPTDSYTMKQLNESSSR